jgi:hypothetical protein
MRRINTIVPCTLLFLLFLFSGIGCRGYRLKRGVKDAGGEGNGQVKDAGDEKWVKDAGDEKWVKDAGDEKWVRDGGDEERVKDGGNEGICSQLVIDNQGIPEWYPDKITEDKTRFNQAKKEAERFIKTYNLAQEEIETCEAVKDREDRPRLCLYNYIYTPYTPFYGLYHHSGAYIFLEECKDEEEMIKEAVNKFISKWETFLGLKEIPYEKTVEYCSAPGYFPDYFPDYICRFIHRQSYCGLDIVQPYEGLGFLTIIAWGCEIFSIASNVVPHLVKVPKNPVVSKEEIHQAIIGEKIRWFRFDGTPQEFVITKETPIEFGKIGVFFKKGEGGLEAHLVQEVEICEWVTQEGKCERINGEIISSWTMFIDLLLGEILYIRQNFRT